jgi:hypothetical protein
VQDGDVPVEQQPVDQHGDWHGIGWDIGQRISLNNLKERIVMSIERYIRIIAGSFILISLALAHWVSPYWLWFTAFIGANLIQSGITKWCFMGLILGKLGVGGGSGSCCCTE